MSLLFPLPILQTANPLGPLLDALGASTGIAAEIYSLPSLLRDLIASIQRYRYDLFNQPSTSRLPYDVFVADKLREQIGVALSQIFCWLNNIEATAESSANGSIWSSRCAIWGVVLAWGGYLETDASWASLVEDQARQAGATLTILRTDITANQETANQETAEYVLQILTILERLDHRRASIGPAILGWCLAVSKLNQIQGGIALMYAQGSSSLP